MALAAKKEKEKKRKMLAAMTSVATIVWWVSRGCWGSHATVSAAKKENKKKTRKLRAFTEKITKEVIEYVQIKK